MPASAVAGAPDAAPAAPQSRTASGLVKRTRRSQPEGQRRPANIPSGDLLNALQGHTGKVPAAEIQHQHHHVARAPEPAPEPRPEPRPQLPQRQPQPQPETAGTGTTPSGLVRRVKGAQMPVAQPLSLRRSDAAESAPPPAPAAAPAPPPAQGGVQPPPGSDDGAARDVYGFLSSFSSGVQRGLDESRGS
jgi:hypothetical protein